MFDISGVFWYENCGFYITNNILLHIPLLHTESQVSFLSLMENTFGEGHTSIHLYSKFLIIY